MMKLQHCLVIILSLGLMACSSSKHQRPQQDGAPNKVLNPALIKDPKPKHEPYSKYGNPDTYTVLGKKYEVWESHLGYEQTGTASWYGTKFHGQLTSSREPYDMYAMTAAHKNLPIPSYAKVTNLDNGKSVIVRVNDRGPFAHDRIIDLSYAAATKLDMLGKGTARVKVEAIDTKRLQPTPPSYKNIESLYLQVAAFSERGNAENLANQLRNHSNDTKVEVNQSERLYRVYVGPFTHEAQAHAFGEKLAALNLGKGLLIRGTPATRVGGS